jgi:ribosomal subunit interface protein
MDIDIQARDFSLTTALRNHVLRRLDAALRHRYDVVHRIRIRLGDINGPRGGADKRCHVQVVLPGLQDVIIENIEDDLYVAIDRAAERVGRTVNRRLRRQRARHQRTGRPRSAVETDHPAVSE